MILPALVEAKSPYWRPIKYSLFPPLGLATLAGYFDDDEIRIQDEHVESLDLDWEPDLVAIQVYITSAYRAYELADHFRSRDSHVVMGGLHVTALPEESMAHADTIITGPAEHAWPEFLRDFRAGTPQKFYRSHTRSLQNMPNIRRDLIRKNLYLVPNSIVVSRGCPHCCDFCYKEQFFTGGQSFYHRDLDDALAEINGLPGRHLFFLDDHLLGNPRFAGDLFDSMRGMNRVWQAAATVDSLQDTILIQKAADSGLRSLFIGFETLNDANLWDVRKHQNRTNQYNVIIKNLHNLGVMVNASFVFGFNQDDSSVFERTVEWAIQQGIETATFHILTPYPGSRLYSNFEAANRIVTHDWDRYDTRHAVFQPIKMSGEQLEKGYWHSYDHFYKWSSIFRSAFTKKTIRSRFRQFAYTAGWKKFELLWDWLIRAKRVYTMLPFLESLLDGNHPSANEYAGHKNTYNYQEQPTRDREGVS